MMTKQSWQRRMRAAAISLLPFRLRGCSFVQPSGAHAQERMALAPLPAGIRMDSIGVGYQAGGTLGFTLRDITLREQLYRRDAGAERGIVWSAEFASRWPLNEDRLDRWSAQAIG